MKICNINHVNIYRFSAFSVIPFDYIDWFVDRHYRINYQMSYLPEISDEIRDSLRKIVYRSFNDQL